MNFASDNTAGIAPEILAAHRAAPTTGAALAYGQDAWTSRVERRFAEIFEREVAVFLVPTGTAANALALAHLTPPWGAVLCHAEAHIATDECGAPEFFGGGLKLIGLPGEAGKIAPETLAARARARPMGRPASRQRQRCSRCRRRPKPAPSIVPAEIAPPRRDRARARARGACRRRALRQRARAHERQSPADATWKAGVDVLSFGATKGGALAAEAVVFFDPARGADMAERRKRGGHLVSKHRFIAAQFEALSGRRPVARARAPRQRHGRPAGRRAYGGRVSRRSGRSRPTRCSSRCRARSTRGSRPRARATIRGRSDGCRKARCGRADATLVRLVTSFATTRGRGRPVRAIVRVASSELQEQRTGLRRKNR